MLNLLQVAGVSVETADALRDDGGGLCPSLPLRQGVLKLQTCHCSWCMHIHAGKRLSRLQVTGSVRGDGGCPARWMRWAVPELAIDQAALRVY